MRSRTWSRVSLCFVTVRLPVQAAGASCHRGIRGCASRGQVHSPAPAGAATAPTGSSRAASAVHAVFDVEEVEPRRIEGELERRRPAARAVCGSSRAVKSVGVRREERRLVVLHPRSRRRARGASTPEAGVRVGAELLEDVDLDRDPREVRRREGAVLEGLRPDAEHDPARARRGGFPGRAAPRAARSARRRPRARLDEVHGGRADERGDEDVRAAARRAAAARSTCTSRPSRITATRWPSVIASVWSCVT